MAEPKPCVLALSSDAGIITDVQEITATLIRFTLLSPGFLTTLFRDEEVSFRNLASRYGHNRDALCGALSAKVGPMLKKYFPEYDVLANFTPSDYDLNDSGPLDPRYIVTFDITYRDKNKNIVPGIGSHTLTINTEGQITIHYNSANSRT